MESGGADLCAFRYRAGMKSVLLAALGRFYPGASLAINDACRTRRERLAVSRLVRLGLLARCPGGDLSGRYSITLRGKCKILCCALGMTFPCLCVLSRAYVFQTAQRQSRCKQYYPLEDARGALEGVYSGKTMSNAKSALCSQGIADSVTDHIIRIRDSVMAGLVEHAGALAELHEWTGDVQDRIGRAAIGRMMVSGS